ncbi:Hpt domain-containing protein [Peribacillus glennii]|uniref:HPt domain-containing protein n=1 Tax=Peribacillus glennii TaxID=2303991 RepID=A0A372LFX8_9BACI|nr:Hpt domain-containing protein [Peribacillus glennii]RFU65201.1 hypothetical protein D0466_04665 [Peribacillus glennii]
MAINIQYEELFIEESLVYLQALNDHLLKLEVQREDIEIVGQIFQSVHRFKGIADTMGFIRIADLAHCMEDVLDLMRKRKLPVTDALVDLILESIEALERMVDSIRQCGDGRGEVSLLVRMLEQVGRFA